MRVSLCDTGSARTALAVVLFANLFRGGGGGGICVLSLDVYCAHLCACACRDTIVSGFDAGYAGGEDVRPYDPSLRDPVYALLTLALILTAGRIA